MGKQFLRLRFQWGEKYPSKFPVGNDCLCLIFDGGGNASLPKILAGTTMYHSKFPARSLEQELFLPHKLLLAHPPPHCIKSGSLGPRPSRCKVGGPDTEGS